MSLGVWALVAAAAVAWGLRVFVQPLPVPAGAAVADTAPVLQADLTRLLGADPPPPATAPEEAAPPPDTRFTLVGVVAPRGAGAAGRPSRSSDGVALIAIDGQPARAYRVGARVEGETVLQSVNARGAELGPRGGPARIALALPPPAPPATGSLPAVSGMPPMTQPNGVRPPAPVPPFARPALQRQGTVPPYAVPPPNFQPAEPAPAQPDAMPQRNTNPTLM